MCGEMNTDDFYICACGSIWFDCGCEELADNG